MADPNIIPFAEGAPADDLMVEELPDGDVLIGDPALDIKDELRDEDFGANLAEEIDIKELQKKAAELISLYESDREARSEWEDRYKDGLKTLDPAGGMEQGEDERATRGLSVVIHPLIAEAATQFNARAIAELYPSGGPIKTVIIGDPSEEVEAQSRRVRDYMNFQITQEMPEYFPDLDQMLFHLPLIGHTFKKVWWDANMDRQCSQFVKAEDFVVAPESKDLYTSPRYTHVIRIPKNEFNRYVQNGYYLPTNTSDGDPIDPSGDVIGEIEGVDQYGDNTDDVMTLLEMHVYDLFDGIDGDEMDDGEFEDNAVAIPYVITLDYDNETVVSVRRNWRQDDDLKKRRDWFVSYKFLPGLGFYGFGLYHMIGGLGRAATGSLRACSTVPHSLTCKVALSCVVVFRAATCKSTQASLWTLTRQSMTSTRPLCRCPLRSHRSRSLICLSISLVQARDLPAPQILMWVMLIPMRLSAQPLRSLSRGQRHLAQSTSAYTTHKAKSSSCLQS
jgi:hypothetical protein